MKTIEGNIVDIIDRTIRKGRVYFSGIIESIQYDDAIESEAYILPGLIDAHVHIESSMMSPLEYSKVAIRNGVVAAVTDPHEIANVCGMEGVEFMIKNAQLTPMKISTGAPSCVPATPFETSGACLGSKEITLLFEKGWCSHLSEMMNFPGVVNADDEVLSKLNIAKKYHKSIDGHAPLLKGNDLETYINAGISTDHECTSLEEAIEKIHLGMKIMLRESSASHDFDILLPLIQNHSDQVMFCTDDIHPDDLEVGYINLLVKRAIHAGYSIFDVLSASTYTAINHYHLSVGVLQIKDQADFIVVDSLDEFNILKTVISGNEIYDGDKVHVSVVTNESVNNFYRNNITIEDIQIKANGNFLNVIEISEGSLLTKKLIYPIVGNNLCVQSNIENDIIKIVVVNRYQKAKPAIAFIKGFKLKNGAIAGSIAHDSHNIIAIGVDDKEIIAAIKTIQDNKGGLVVVDDCYVDFLELPIAGLMSNADCVTVALNYKILLQKAKSLGCFLHSPFMTMAFMSLLVIPEIKLSDKGLFDGNKFEIIDLQY